MSNTTTGRDASGEFMQKLKSFSDLLDKAVMWTCAVLLVLMSVDLLVAIFFRYVLFDTIIWSEELARYMMIWMACLAMSSGIKRREHLAILFLPNMLPRPARIALDLIVRMLLAGFLLILMYYGVGLVQANTSFTSMALEVNMSLPTAAVPVCGTIMMIQLVLVTILKYSGDADFNDDEQPIETALEES